MKRAIVTTILLSAIAIHAWGDGSVTVPWETFEQLYKNVLIQNLTQKYREDEKTISQVHVIDTAEYHLKILSDKVVGMARFNGRILKGEPKPIPLLGDNVVITRIHDINGGNLIGGEQSSSTVLFMPDGNSNVIQVAVDFLVQPRANGRTREARFTRPASISSILHIEIPETLQLVEPPGIAGAGDSYYLPVGRQVAVTFRDAPTPEEAERTVAAKGVQISTPTVLESIDFFTSFEEGGHTLSVLVMDVPREFGSRLRLHAVENAEIWSLKINGEPQSVFLEGPDTWGIPLAENKGSHVELAFLREGEKLGLQGRLELVVPGTGLAAQHLNVGIALPGRVQLLSLEGPVNPDPDPPPRTPREFIGTPYFFSRAFYKGEAMEMALFYKEPVK